jgi:hypothetical protein
VGVKRFHDTESGGHVSTMTDMKADTRWWRTHQSRMAEPLTRRMDSRSASDT